MPEGKSISFTGTGTLDAGSGILYTASIAGGAGNGSVVLRTGGSGGTIICTVAVLANDFNEREFIRGIPYTNLHATVTGSPLGCDVETA